jgi:HK97 family phage prohead protease
MNEIRNDKEIRLANIADFSIEHRADEDGGKMIIEGYAALYDDETLIGSEELGFFERIEKGAFDDANMKDVPLKYNHSDAVPILARTRNKSLELKTDDKGLFIHAELLDTQDNIDMYKRIKAGLIDKMSFAFTVNEESYDQKTHTRKILGIDKLYDVSAVSFPANPDTEIDIATRSYLDGVIEAETAERLRVEHRNRQVELLKLRIKLMEV